MRDKIIAICVVIFTNLSLARAEITPFKADLSNVPAYSIPSSSKFLIKGLDKTEPDMIYYFRDC